jgi:hypothetical protein
VSIQRIPTKSIVTISSYILYCWLSASNSRRKSKTHQKHRAKLSPSATHATTDKGIKKAKESKKGCAVSEKIYIFVFCLRERAVI